MVSHDKPPYTLTKKEWERRWNDAWPENVQTRGTKRSASEAQRSFEEIQYLGYNVREKYKKRYKEAQEQGIILPKEELDEIQFQLSRNATHKEVIIKAMEEGHIISDEILKDYPDLASIQFFRKLKNNKK